MSSALAAAFVALVIGASDGDTLTVLHEQTPIRIRLAEIDAPEKEQPFSNRSKQSLSSLCYGIQATVTPQTTDRYGRIVARVSCADKDASAEQVRSGMAWVFDRYVTDKSLYVLQDEARNARRGLWTDLDPIPPWEWRRINRNQHGWD